MSNTKRREGEKRSKLNMTGDRKNKRRGKKRELQFLRQEPTGTRPTKDKKKKKTSAWNGEMRVVCQEDPFKKNLAKRGIGHHQKTSTLIRPKNHPQK